MTPKNTNTEGKRRKRVGPSLSAFFAAFLHLLFLLLSFSFFFLPFLFLCPQFHAAAKTTQRAQVFCCPRLSSWTLPPPSSSAAPLSELNRFPLRRLGGIFRLTFVVSFFPLPLPLLSAQLPRQWSYFPFLWLSSCKAKTRIILPSLFFRHRPQLCSRLLSSTLMGKVDWRRRRKGACPLFLPSPPLSPMHFL